MQLQRHRQDTDKPSAFQKAASLYHSVSWISEADGTGPEERRRHPPSLTLQVQLARDWATHHHLDCQGRCLAAACLLSAVCTRSASSHSLTLLSTHNGRTPGPRLLCTVLWPTPSPPSLNTRCSPARVPGFESQSFRPTGVHDLTPGPALTLHALPLGHLPARAPRYHELRVFYWQIHQSPAFVRT